MPTASNNVYPKEREHFTAKEIRTPSGKRVLDFGQNIAGYLTFTVKGKPGQVVKLTCGEILDESGEFTQKNMQVSRPAGEYGKLDELMLITGNEGKIRCSPRLCRKLRFSAQERRMSTDPVLPYLGSAMHCLRRKQN